MRRTIKKSLAEMQLIIKTGNIFTSKKLLLNIVGGKVDSPTIGMPSPIPDDPPADPNGLKFY